MMGVGAVLRDMRRPDAAQFLRFCAVGTVGFCVDAAVLIAAIHLLGAGPIWGRMASATMAVLATFELNRRWAFRHAGRRRYWTALGAYVGVQGFGFLCNLAVYMALSLSLPHPFDDPLLCLAAASGAALAINYTGASLVFRCGAG